MTNAERQKLWEARQRGDYSEGFLPGADDEGDGRNEHRAWTKELKDNGIIE